MYLSTFITRLKSGGVAMDAAEEAIRGFEIEIERLVTLSRDREVPTSLRAAIASTADELEHVTKRLRALGLGHKGESK